MAKNTSRARMEASLRKKGLTPKADEKPAEKEKTTEQQFLDLANEANKKCSDSTSKGQLNRAFEHGKEALGYYLKAFNMKEGSFSKDKLINTGLSEIYYNLALTRETEDIKGALDYLGQAHRFNPRDEDIIYRQWMCNFLIKNYKESLAVINEATVGASSVKDILAATSKLYMGQVDILAVKIQIKESVRLAKTVEEKEWVKSAQLFIGARLGEYEGVVSLLEEQQKSSERGSIADIHYSFCNTLAMYCETFRYNEGLQYLKSMYKSYPALRECDESIATIYYKLNLRICSNEDMDKREVEILLDKIVTYTGSDPMYLELKEKAKKLYFLRLAVTENYIEAKAWLEKNTCFGPNLDNFYLKLLDYQLKRATTKSVSTLPVNEASYNEELAIAIIEAESAIPAPQKEREEVAPAAKTSLEEREENQAGILPSPHEEKKPETAGSIGSETSALEPWRDFRAINAYFQRKLANQAIEKALVKTKAVHSWIYKEKKLVTDGSCKYEIKGVGTIYKVFNSDNYFVYIKEGICRSEKEEEAFVNAIINKGFITEEVGKNGIKYCKSDSGKKNKLAEVKANFDARIWTDLTLLSGGKYIMVIETRGTHEEFKKAAQSGRMRIENVESLLPHEKLKSASKYEPESKNGSLEECKKKKEKKKTKEKKKNEKAYENIKISKELIEMLEGGEAEGVKGEAAGVEMSGVVEGPAEDLLE